MKPVILALILLCCYLSFPARTDGQVKASEKLSPALKSSILKKNISDSLEIYITVKDLARLKQDSEVLVVSEYKSTNTALVKISSAKLLRLLDTNEVVFADVHRIPRDELTTGSLDISLNKISFSHNRFPSINGETINVSLKEQGFDSTDIDIKGRVFGTGVGSNVQSSHAAIMATMLTGAGNTSPFAKGAAWGANLSSSGYTTLLPDADGIYSQYRLSVQNHSYGTGIENYYGADAASYDMSVWNNPTLLHVFSSGNSGNSSSSSGSYSGLAGFANLTGSFKMAKNIITVGATDSFNVVAILSSRGPAFDGRVKPDLIAFGEDGSSGSAALVSGSAALVQQAYKIDHNHLPSSALVKAVLLNSADDVGQQHVDFISGYGSLNAAAAVSSIKEKRFFEGSIVQNEIKTFPITIPPGVSQLKLTITWTDTAATPNSTKALVNDIDALLQLPVTNETWQPWVLSSYPNKDSLLLAAIRKTDTLNNTEQITIDNPQAGNYLVGVRGSRIQTSKPQAFAIAYQLDTANRFTWTFPTSTDVLTASGRNILRWQTNIIGTGRMEFSANGTQWHTIDPAVDLSLQYFKWDVPDTITTAFLRMNPNSYPEVISGNFVISKPLSINVGFDCPDSFLLYWNRTKLTPYQVYSLGDKYLGPLQTTSDSFIVFQKQQHPRLFYSVAPLINGKPGQRSYTINYTSQGVACFVKTFFALLQNNTAFLTAEMGSLYNVAEISFQKITGLGVSTLSTISNPLSLSLSFTDSQLTQGLNLYRLQVKLKDGNIVFSNTDLVYYFPEHPVLVYPNPAKQNEGVNIIARDPGVYSIHIYDVHGRLLHRQRLDNITQKLHPLVLAKGLYFIKIVAQDGKTFEQKFIVY